MDIMWPYGLDTWEIDVVRVAKMEVVVEDFEFIWLNLASLDRMFPCPRFVSKTLHKLQKHVSTSELSCD